jgi:hypothetical protein
MSVRPLRIAVVAIALPILFEISQRAGEARGNERVPGMLIALGILSLLFLVRAAVSEATPGAASPGQRDLQWGLALGGAATIVSQLLGIAG